jgi:predicted TIM-barrel fold metal-dependent hydrolase
VLVQPSVYGSDNSVLLRALRERPGRHRGVVVLDADVGDSELDALHEAGVRGVRFNRVSPVGNDAAALPALAQRIAERGWHAQWYVHPAQLAELVPLQARSSLTFVFDHLAGITAQSPQPHWDALRELAASGAWIKLSGWYRLGMQAPYDEVVPLVQRVAGLFPDRMVWGSDWPHTSLPGAGEHHASLLRPVRLALGDAAVTSLLRNHPPLLYLP